MHSKPQTKAVERLTCRESWKSCSPAKTKAQARMSPPFLQRSCALRSRFEGVLKSLEKVNFIHAIKDKVVVITARASSGIGEGSAVRLAERGAKVVLGAPLD